MNNQLITRFKDTFRVLLGRAKAVPTPERYIKKDSKFSCPVCNKRISSFLPLSPEYIKQWSENGFIHPVFLAETLNIPAYSCPMCGASDRERLYALYFNKFSAIINRKQFRLLDVAPSSSLQRFLSLKFPEINYRTAGLMMQNVDDCIDIRNMHIYDDSSFDFIICSHVLEHIVEDFQAIGELFRVLKPGGRSILMVPILLNLKEDYENPEIIAPHERWKHFGQDDHVRVYSKEGFKRKLQAAGFKIKEYGINDFGMESFSMAGIHPQSVLYVAEKEVVNGF